MAKNTPLPRKYSPLETSGRKISDGKKYTPPSKNAHLLKLLAVNYNNEPLPIWVRTETLYYGDDALSSKPAQLISATRGRASQPKVLVMATDCSATCQQG